MKYFMILFVFLLPFHALGITFLKCKLGVNTDIVRFWKEFIVIFLFAITCFSIWKTRSLSHIKGYGSQHLWWLLAAFLASSVFFTFFPSFSVETYNLIGLRYDVFFLLVFFVGLYLVSAQKYFSNMLYALFMSGGMMLAIFLPWFLFGDISLMVNMFGYSPEVSTYQPNSCISFAQNVTGGHHRFQGSFSGPIRFSTFLTVFFFIFLGYVLQKKTSSSSKTGMLVFASMLVIPSIFFAYSKSSILGLVFGALTFAFLTYRFLIKDSKTKKYISRGCIIALIGMVITLVLQRDMFLHLGALKERVVNLRDSFVLLAQNPFGYGLGSVGPASRVGEMQNEALPGGSGVLLPENWYIQIFLEQGIFGGTLFVIIIVLVGNVLFQIVRNRKDFLSIGMFCAFASLCFISLFTHGFEEAATSYILFLLLGIFIAKNTKSTS